MSADDAVEADLDQDRLETSLEAEIGFTGDNAVDPQPPEYEPSVVSRIILGVWTIKASDHKTFWLWQVDPENWYYRQTEAPCEYLLALPGFDSMDQGFYKCFTTRADAMRSLGLPPTD
jgi:hypothetical protein